MPRKHDVAEEQTVAIQTELGPLHLGILVNDEPAFVTRVSDGDDVFMLETESGDDHCTIIVPRDEEALRERYG